MKLVHPNGTVLVLPDDLLWTDEFEWSALAQAEPERTLSGAVVVQQGIKRAGRPITLAPPDDGMAWVSRQAVETLQAWAMLPETVFALRFGHGDALKVLFDNHNGAVSAKPVLGYGAQTPESWFVVELKLMTVER